MLLQVGEQAIVENILLGMKANDITLPKTDEEFRVRYQQYLQRMQPHCFWLRNDPQQSLDKTVSDEATKRRLMEIFGEDTSRLDDRNQKDVIKAETLTATGSGNPVTDALSAMSGIAPSHKAMLDSCIECIFYEGSDVAAGGSTSSAVGVIWANPHPAFALNDNIEFLVHELTHNLMFLDEWVHPHYSYDRITDEATWCQSAILKTRRPIDKVVHSIVVATEIVLLRRLIVGEPLRPAAHPPSADIVAAVIASIADIRGVPSVETFVHARVWELLANVEHKLLGDEGAGSNSSATRQRLAS